MSDRSNRINHKLFVKENREVRFSDATMECVRKIIARYPEGRQKSALLPVLHIAQEELGGFLSVDVMDYVASLLGIQPIEVYEVATFYSMFYLEKTGKYVIDLCLTGPCSACGGEQIMDYLKKKLNIQDGETTHDGLFTLRAVECLGACGNAPVMQINNEFYESLTTEKIDRIIEELTSKAGDEKPEGTKWVEKYC
ncbi:MAG: NADH-quinone oxidoreductase subunit NuoE [Syntrophothermus sp.]